MAWNRLEFPNGNNYDLEGMAGADLSGYAGMSGDVDNHYFRIFSSALLFSVFGAASQLTQPRDSGQNGTTSNWPGPKDRALRDKVEPLKWGSL